MLLPDCYKDKILRIFVVVALLSCQQLSAQPLNQSENRLKAYLTKGIHQTNTTVITPNDFKGTDTERIQAAIHKAGMSTNEVVIPRQNDNGTNIWKIDSAILLPDGMTVLLYNCVIQLSDQCRDNMFRSDNVGIGIKKPQWSHDISIIGIGNPILKGANNPRSTGDAFRKLVKEQTAGRVSYGSDAGNANRKQTGDWRNIMILMAYVKGLVIKNVTIKNSHSWAMSFERVRNAEISDIQFYNPQFITVSGRAVYTSNKDGIDLRQGCKYFRINNITGVNGDDLIALSSLDVAPFYHTNGDINSYQVTTTAYKGEEDDIEQIFITNCKTNYTGVAIRAGGNAGVHDVFINGIITRARPDISPPYGGSPYTLLVGNKNYGKRSLRGKIHDIYAMNLTGDGKHLILIKSPIANCSFMNGIYTGSATNAITYDIDKNETRNIKTANLINATVGNRFSDNQ